MRSSQSLGWLLAFTIVVVQPANPALSQTTTVLTGQSPSATYVHNSSLNATQSHPAYHQAVVKKVYVKDNRTYFQRHPKVKAAAIGAGVGAAGGAVLGGITHKGVGHGALIGAGTGAGVGLVRSSHTLKRHPVARDVATGSLVGLGVGAITSRHHREGRGLEGAAIGGAAGLGVGIFKHGL